MSQRDYVILLDKSGSMGEPNKRNVAGLTRWQRAQETVMSLARKAAETDPDGIDVYSFNTGFTKFANTTPEKVAELFSRETPHGGTDFVPVINDALEAHFSNNKRPTTIICLTDGEPSNQTAGENALAALLIKAANRIEGDAELAVGFIQVGDDPKASAFLKRLDDDLQKQGAKFDIVDTLTADEIDAMTTDQVLAHIIAD